MWAFADRMAKMVSDVTVGTVIVLVHVALAEREHGRTNTNRRLAAPSMPITRDVPSVTARSSYP